MTFVLDCITYGTFVCLCWLQMILTIIQGMKKKKILIRVRLEKPFKMLCLCFIPVSQVYIKLIFFSFKLN